MRALLENEEEVEAMLDLGRSSPERSTITSNVLLLQLLFLF